PGRWPRWTRARTAASAPGTGSSCRPVPARAPSSSFRAGGLCRSAPPRRRQIPGRRRPQTFTVGPRPAQGTPCEPISPGRCSPPARGQPTDRGAGREPHRPDGLPGRRTDGAGLPRGARRTTRAPPREPVVGLEALVVRLDEVPPPGRERRGPVAPQDRADARGELAVRPRRVGRVVAVVDEHVLDEREGPVRCGGEHEVEVLALPVRGVEALDRVEGRTP